VKSGHFLYWPDACIPRVRRAAGALEPDPEGRGGVAGGSTPVVYKRPGRPDLDTRRSRFEGSQYLVRLQATESPNLSYQDV
jgi:hypothetical protein